MAVRVLNDKHTVITDVVFMWAKVHEPTPKYNPEDGREYSVVCLIDRETKKELEKMKLNKNFKEVDEDKYPDYEGLYEVKFAQPEKNRAGKTLIAPIVIGPDMQQTDSLIGNGSKGQIKLFTMQGMGASKGKINARLHSVLVQDMVEYEGGSDLDGFEVDESAKKAYKAKPRTSAADDFMDDEDFSDDDLPF